MTRRVTAALCAMVTALPALLIAAPASADLSQAMDAIRARDWDRAQAQVRWAGDTPRAIVDWHRLRAGLGEFDEYIEFRTTHGNWPGMPLLIASGEPRIPANADPDAVIRYFDGRDPETGTGVLRLTDALEKAGRSQDARQEAIRAWREMTLDPLSENLLLTNYGQAIGEYDTDRMDALLWREAWNAAERMRPRVPEGWRRLHDARVALHNDTPGVDARIAAVPDALADNAGLAYERMAWRARRGRTDDAIALMLDRSLSAEDLGEPSAWAGRRQVIARQLMRQGDPQQAYLVAAQHHLTEGSSFADLEWLAGYIALQKLDNPAAALAHFRHFRAGVQTPISLGRAGYWEGRAHEAMGQDQQAEVAYGFGAEFQTSFYGQLAAERLGMAMDRRLTGRKIYPIPRGNPLAENSVFQAAMALAEAGESTKAARFFSHMAETLPRGQIGQLLTLTQALGEPNIQLEIAKRAAAYGHVMHRDYFPDAGITVAGRPGVTPELALAIARRESEFNPTAISHAGARGLMQLMPATAQFVAGELGLAYSLGRLTSDPDYNARLGTKYLSVLVDRFGDAPVLVAAGYNAGPGRPQSWMGEYGDPRNGADPVDWIEHIPFTETRNYAMRVTEAILPYRARLSGEVVPLDLSALLRGS